MENMLSNYDIFPERYHGEWWGWLPGIYVEGKGSPLQKKSNRGTGKDELTVEICGAQFFTQDVPFPFGFKSSTMCPGY
jgi:hypothetical protein